MACRSSGSVVPPHSINSSVETATRICVWYGSSSGGHLVTLTAYNQVSVPSFMYGTAWKKEATTSLVLQAVEAGFTAIDTANQVIHYQEALVGEALLELAKQGIEAQKHSRVGVVA